MSGPLAEAVRQLREYFAGKRRDFDLPLALEGTDFQRKVWRKLQEIPYGETISYGELAKRVGNPKASRAVGSANGKNRIPIVIPCHRVIAGDGGLGGFGGGLTTKEKLLAIEKPRANAAKIGALAAALGAVAVSAVVSVPGTAEERVHAFAERFDLGPSLCITIFMPASTSLRVASIRLSASSPRCSARSMRFSASSMRRLKRASACSPR